MLLKFLAVLNSLSLEQRLRTQGMSNWQRSIAAVPIVDTFKSYVLCRVDCDSMPAVSTQYFDDLRGMLFGVG